VLLDRLRHKPPLPVRVGDAVFFDRQLDRGVSVGCLDPAEVLALGVQTSVIRQSRRCDAAFPLVRSGRRYPHGGVNEKLRYTPSQQF
jgi:hypothetical protein